MSQDVKLCKFKSCKSILQGPPQKKVSLKAVEIATVLSELDNISLLKEQTPGHHLAQLVERVSHVPRLCS